MKKWNVKKFDKNIAEKLRTGCGTSALTAAVLAAKGYISPEEVMEKLNKMELTDPFLIKDMQTAADIIEDAIDNGTHICIYGDYDCDGIMATAILYSYLSEIGAEVSYYIPERSEGYGLNKDAVKMLSDAGTELIVTVDNGISAIDEAEYIYSLGMRLVITDHHQQGEELPRAEAVVDPHRHDDFSPFKFCCGAAIAMKLVAALEGGDYTTALAQFGDLAAIATVADIVSLTGENRFIVTYGLQLINDTDRPALIALKEVSGLTGKKVDARAVGFGLSPRINASGRFGSPKTALKLFLTEDPDEAMAIANELDRLNSARKNTENQIISEIYKMVDDDPSLLRDRAICICGKGWHHGVIGIVAARISEQFGKPCFIASEENGEIRGSARSFGGFSVFAALTAASEALVKFGGHPGAGGYTVKSGMAGEFRRLINEYAKTAHNEMPFFELTADAVISPAHLTVGEVQTLETLEPFGADNEKPLFLIENALVTDIIAVSQGVHTKLRIKFGDSVFEAMMFRKSPAELNVSPGSRCNMMVNLGINTFREKTSVSIYISDILPCGLEQKKYFAALRAFEAHMRGEALPQNYYPVMLPSRETCVRIYKFIPEGGIDTDTLYLRLSDPDMNYCRFSTAIEAMRQMGLVKLTSADGRVSRLPVSGRVDLNAAPVLAGLREKIKCC